MTDVDQHDYHCLDIFESATHDAYFFIFFEEAVIPVDLEPDIALGLFLNSLQ